MNVGVSPAQSHCPDPKPHPESWNSGTGARTLYGARLPFGVEHLGGDSTDWRTDRDKQQARTASGLHLLHHFISTESHLLHLHCTLVLLLGYEKRE